MLYIAILLLCAVFVSSTGIPVSDGYILQELDFDSNFPLIHLTLNNRDSFVYISAVNRIYQLGKDLQEDSIIQVTTGPVNDSQECLPYAIECSSKLLNLTDNYNKLFLMDIDRDRLLICGSIYQGICEARSLQNIKDIKFSHEKEDGQYEFQPRDYISCVDKNCTTIGVIAEGPTVFNPVLYVANTFVETTYKDAVGFLSTRSLHVDPTKENKLFLYAVDDGITRFSVLPLPDATKNYQNSKQYFKYGFSTEGADGFVYFLFQKIEGKVMKTKISRTCKKDEFYKSYIEMSLECTSANEELVAGFYQKNVGYTDSSLGNTIDGVLYVVFKTASRSSLCAFTIYDLNEKFDDTTISCYKYNGKNSKGNETIAKTGHKSGCTDWMSPDINLDSEIARVNTVPRLDYYPEYDIGHGKLRCGAFFLPSLIERIPVVHETWAYHQPRVTFSAITVNLVDSINVAYIGTEEGQIIELNINRKHVYSTIDVGLPILSDLTLDESLPVPNLYVLTKSKVLHMRVAACERHTTCSDCLGARDPYCGWCIWKNSCMLLNSECPAVSWLEPLSTECIEASEPEPIERTLGAEVTIMVTKLPKLQSTDDSYSCIYNGTLVTEARVDANDQEKIICQAPSSDDLPEDFDEEDHVNVSLGIRYNDAVDIVSTTATFYDCKAHGSSIDLYQPCQSCIKNRWEGKCQWCIASHTCSPMERGVCTQQTESCPKVISASDDTKLLPVGLPTEIKLNVANLLQQADAEYTCQVDLEGSQRVPAVITGDQITCQKQTYKYSEKAVEIPANVTVFRNDKYIIDAEVFDPISFYNCSVKFDDCSLCVTSKPEYKCGWCGSICTIQQTCDEDWVTNAASCPSPEIQSFSPISGPIAGNTSLTIKGKNMGVSVDDISSVTVAGVACILKKDLYQISKQIVCQTGAASGELDGKVSITLQDSTEVSVDSFHYRNPTLLEVVPRTGPKAGGTLIAVKGTNLDTGSSTLAFVDSLPCQVQIPLRNSSVLECKTSPSDTTLKNLTVTVSFDGFPVKIENAFSYAENPKILSYTTASKKFSGFLAGGRDIVVTGNRLNIVQDARIVAFVQKRVISKIPPGRKRRKRDIMKSVAHLMLTGTRTRRAASDYVRYSADCSVINSTVMICPTPKIDSTVSNTTLNNTTNIEPLKVSLRLMLDNINEKMNKTLKYYPNPIVLPPGLDQTKDVRSGANAFLTIKVLNLNKDAITENEIIIMIGDERCPVESIYFDKGNVQCKIPPPPKGEKTNFPITVKMGNNIYKDLGELTYFVTPPALTQTIIIILIIAGVAFLCLLIVAIFCCIKRNKHYKENKNDFQIALENLEMSVRADFRKAFAELSIDMTDLTADIGDVGLPILNYRQYAMNMFFQGMRYHPCMQEPDPSAKPIPAVEQGFVQFNLLLTNKHFLLSFIHTLEQQRGFSHRDKGNVASLLTVVLHRKFDYFTEVMKLLIAELVESSVQRNPKVVLRRTESVAERMFSNWMAVCLYPFIRDKAGKPLFLLQKAIKHQVSKGASDAVTGKARYTLSDDRLLKEDIPQELLTLFVSQTDNDDPIIVKVLSCDTISQVKEKVMDAVYKRIPFSIRPKADLLDLEWRHGRSGHLILPALDYANEPGSRWRRVMTIKDYKVENNATMALIQRNRSSDVVDQYTNQSPDTSVISPMLPEENMKIYHLVKYTDDIEQKRESTIPRDRHKHILDLYLLRLINMKGILQSYVDGVFQAILDTTSIPPAVKHFFDFLDELGNTHGIEDPEILHMWKTNGVLGRFWVTILKNPESVFDIDKPESVESSMAVISQTFIDACSVQEHKPTKDSPINKQLYAKEIPTYKKMVQKYYSDARDMPSVSGQDMSAHMTEISRSHNVEFDVHVAYNELWGYVNKYYEEIQETLSSDPDTTQMVIQRLEQTYTLIDSSVNNP